jgi:DNA-binding transcriptional LysR family regulator
MESPSLRQLDLFAQMVAAGGLTRCADTLGLDPQDIAREIASLEMRLGFRLFDDLYGNARLTDAGHKTARAMTLLTEDAPELPEPVPTQQEKVAPILLPAELPAAAPRETIMLGAPPSVFNHFQDALSAFEAANEDVAITLDLHIQSAAQAGAALQSGRADIAYFYALGDSEELPSRYGWSEPVNLYAAVDHPLAKADSVSREDLRSAPLLTMARSNPLRLIVEDALALGRAYFAPAAIESDDMFAILSAMRNQTGLFAAFGTLARDIGRMQGIRRLALDMPLPSIEIRQAIGPDATEKPAVGALAEFLFL